MKLKRVIITQEELNELVRKHQLWLEGKEGGERLALGRFDLSGLNLSSRNLRGCRFGYCDLTHCDLSQSDLSQSDLIGCSLRGCNLSGAVGLLSPIDFMKENFEQTEEGFIAYKAFNATFTSPESWTLAPHSVISENVNYHRTDGTGCGINVATLKWVRKRFRTGDIWKVLIRWEWLCGVVVPYNTSGQIRCERCELIEIVPRS